MTTLQSNAAKAGYLLGGSLGLIRLAGTRTIEDLLLVVALTGAEFSVVWFLEKKAGTIEANIAARQEEIGERGRAEGRVRDAADEFARREKVQDDTVAEIHQLERDCEHDHVMGDLSALTAIAVKSVKNGYYRGIERNKGDLGGVPEVAA